MSTIYRYLDVLSVEKCIDNINDFIKPYFRNTII